MNIRLITSLAVPNKLFKPENLITIRYLMRQHKIPATPTTVRNNTVCINISHPRERS